MGGDWRAAAILRIWEIGANTPGRIGDLMGGGCGNFFLVVSTKKANTATCTLKGLILLVRFCIARVLLRSLLKGLGVIDLVGERMNPPVVEL